jgi:hypothetical protein
MKKLIFSLAFIGMTAFLAQPAMAGGGCKGKGCTCTGSCKDEKCTMACCTGKDDKACKKGDKNCTKDCKKDSKTTGTSTSTGSNQK